MSVFPSLCLSSVRETVVVVVSHLAHLPHTMTVSVFILLLAVEDEDADVRRAEASP